MPDTFAIAERTASLMSLVLIFGAAIFRMRVIGSMRRPGASAVETDFAERLSAIAKSIAAATAATLVVLAGIRMHTQVTALFDGWGAVTATDLRALVLDSMWGRAWLLQLLCAAAIASGPIVGRALDVWFAVPLAVSAAMNGHAAAVTGVGPLAIAADALHALGAGGWAGGVFFVFVATRIASGPSELLDAVRGFSRVAFTSVGILVVTGVFAAFMHLNSFGDLVSSEYGAQLVVKVLFVAAMAAMGAWNWRRSTPALAVGDARSLRRGVAIELFIAITIVLSTARLVLLSPPEPTP